MTIREKVIEKLEKEGQVDNFWCIDNRITTRLSAVILNLKNEGYEFDDEKSGYLGDSKNWNYVLKTKQTLF